MKNNTYPSGYYEIFSDQETPRIRCFHRGNFAFVPHMHVQIEMIYILSGSMEIRIDEKNCLLPAGSIAFISPNQIHSFQVIEDGQCFVTIFEPHLILELENLLKKNSPLNQHLISSPETIEVEKYFWSLEKAVLESNQLLSKGYLSIILASIINLLEFTTPSTHSNYMIQNILNYIYRNYQDNITLDKVATNLGVSKFYISHLFNSELNCSFSNYINYLRINKAKELMLTDKNITEIAYECGFESLRNFYRSFSKHCGMTPLHYRNNC